MQHRLLTDAGGRPVTALPGASTFDSATSFGLIRGGHVDMTVLGGLQVDQSGHLANWMIPGKMVPGMGGAMDLASGARRVVIAMQHSAKGKSKVVKACNLPLTSARPIDLLVTELAVISFPGGRATLQETAPGVSVQQVLDATEAELDVPPNVRRCRLASAKVDIDRRRRRSKRVVENLLCKFAHSAKLSLPSRVPTLLLAFRFSEFTSSAHHAQNREGPVPIQSALRSCISASAAHARQR